jgi:glycosyltransferase involved in cell wall biosynthesis
MLPYLVSICIPCHNAARYVGAALESALEQTWPNLEIIVVNDGSTDGSDAVLADFEGRAVHVIHEKCGSAAKARNRALREAKGDYVKFFDADDLLSPGMVELQIQRLKGRQDAVASSEWGRFYCDDLGSFRSQVQSVWRDMEATDWLIEAWADARPMMQPGMFLIPRALLNESGGWEEELSLIDDFEFFARVLCHTSEVLFTSEAILYYRSGLTGSLSGQNSRKAIESAYQALIKGTSHLLQRRDDVLARRSCANILQDFIYGYYPDHADLLAEVAQRVKALGGSDLRPEGPPVFQAARRFIGWRAARRLQRLRTRPNIPAR